MTLRAFVEQVERDLRKNPFAVLGLATLLLLGTALWSTTLAAHRAASEMPAAFPTCSVLPDPFEEPRRTP